MRKILLLTLGWLLGLVPALAQTADGPQVRPVANFHAITVGTGIELQLTAGPSQRVEVSATKASVRDHIITTVTGGVLSIHYENPDDRGYSDGKQLRPEKLLRVAVTADRLTALTAESNARVRTTGNFATPDFQLDVLSDAVCQLADLTVNVLVVRQGGGSSVLIKGQAPRFDLRIISGSNFYGEKLRTDRSQVEASDGSMVRLDVREALIAEARSGASIRYSGSPAVTKNVSTGGSINRR